VKAGLWHGATIGAMSALIRPATPMPVQIRDLIAGMIGRGELGPGDRLPPIRSIAAQYEVGPGTAARAVRLLATEGLVETKGRAGTFVLKSAEGGS
jgi:DNA-binding GntR family transcriptional regulator